VWICESGKNFWGFWNKDEERERFFGVLGGKKTKGKKNCDFFLAFFLDVFKFVQLKKKLTILNQQMPNRSIVVKSTLFVTEITI
jgi:hypothetical protein